MIIEDIFSIGSVGLIFGFLIAFIVGILATIVNAILRFLRTY